MHTSPISYKRHRFPPQVIAHAVWFYFRFPLSLRLVKEMLLERGINVTETISYLSKFASLQPGDIISTGTLSGAGLDQKPNTFLKARGVMPISIEGLGNSAKTLFRAKD